jgi:gluconate 2-dehydrogenase gamma chain
MNDREASRRSFLVGSISRLGSSWLASCWPGTLAGQELAQRLGKTLEPAKLKFFSPQQAVELEALAAQIIPSDDTPGAREARIIYFIDHALTTFDRDKQALYSQGLRDVQVKADALFPNTSRFSQLTSAQQIQLLTAIERTEFFELVRMHTVIGFFANPNYGGNYNKIGWKLISYDDSLNHKPPFGYYDAQAQSQKG